MQPISVEQWIDTVGNASNICSQSVLNNELILSDMQVTYEANQCWTMNLYCWKCMQHMQPISVEQWIDSVWHASNLCSQSVLSNELILLEMQVTYQPISVEQWIDTIGHASNICSQSVFEQWIDTVWSAWNICSSLVLNNELILSEMHVTYAAH